MITVREAEGRDLLPTLAIYNREVVSGTATFDLEPKTESEWAAFMSAHNVGNHPLFVAEADGEVVGYASLSPYRDRGAFAPTVELSVYVAEEHRRCGVADALMRAIIGAARADGRTHMIVSVITGGNEASVRLHEKYGFTYCGTLSEVGYKFGAYRDIQQYTLNVGAGTEPQRDG